MDGEEWKMSSKSSEANTRAMEALIDAVAAQHKLHDALMRLGHAMLEPNFDYEMYLHECAELRERYRKLSLATPRDAQ
jgi:hypothetical protein